MQSLSALGRARIGAVFGAKVETTKFAVTCHEIISKLFPYDLVQNVKRLSQNEQFQQHRHTLRLHSSCLIRHHTPDLCKQPLEY